MKNFIALITLLLFSVSVPVQAQTPVDVKTANAYFDNCMAQDTPMMSALSKEEMCACTAQKMTEGFTLEDMQNLSNKDESGKLAMSKMLLNVYAPCMQYPSYDYHYNTCLDDENIYKISQEPEELCHCMASQVANYMEQNGRQLFADLLEKNQEIFDPMTALAEDPDFQMYAQTQLLNCYAENR